jgi:hypothetical protein
MRCSKHDRFATGFPWNRRRDRLARKSLGGGDADDPDRIYEKSSIYVDRILRGTMPAELPV